MQWRPLTMLLCGMAMIYLACLLQDSPLPSPVKVHTSDSTRLRIEPDKIMLTIAHDYLYQTAVRFEATLAGQENEKAGTGTLKTGTIGFIQQLRKPVKAILNDSPGPKEDEWEVGFEHVLAGPVSKVSLARQGDKGVQFAVLYHIIKDETVQHVARVYYLTTGSDISDPSSFAFKDLVLPGSTWINAISLEKDSLLISRDRDVYHYRIIPLPKDLTAAPHSEYARPILLPPSEPAQVKKAWYEPFGTEKHQIFLSRLYSPVPETYRVLSFDVHKTSDIFHVNVSVADNASTVTQLSELRGDPPRGRWRWRQHSNLNYDVYPDLTMDYKNGFVDMMRFRPHMPTECFSRSLDAKSVVFPYLKTQFLSLDYTERIDLVMMNEYERQVVYKHEDGTIMPEFYSWQEYDLDISDAYEAEITGVHVSHDGTLLAVWTEMNMVYIYMRGEADKPKVQGPESDSQRDTAPDGWPSEAANHTSAQEDPPAEWTLRLIISKVEGELGSSPVTAAKFTKDTQGRRYILVALKKGAVRSYMIDGVEEPGEPTLKTFFANHGNMLFAMSLAVICFVSNEHHAVRR